METLSNAMWWQYAGERPDAGRAEHRTKGSDEPCCCQPEKSSPFSSGFSTYTPDAMGGTGILRSEQGKIQSLVTANGKIADSITGRVEKRDIPASQTAFENSGSSGGHPALQLSESSCLNVKRNCAGRSWRIQNVVARSDRRNNSGKMTMPLWIQGTERSRYGVWRGPHAR